MTEQVLGTVDGVGRLRQMKLVIKKVSDLKPVDTNVKLHPEHQIDAIAKSIQSTGFCDPITVDEYDNIIDGHGRRLALLKLGVEEVPCIVVPMNSITQRAYGIAHNQTTLSSSFDYKKLKDDIEGMGLQVDDLLSAGFDRDSLRLVSGDGLGLDADALKTFKEDSSSWKHLTDKVFKVDLEFRDEDEQFLWSNFLLHLKMAYPTHETISDRIMQFIEDNSGVERA